MMYKRCISLILALSLILTYGLAFAEGDKGNSVILPNSSEAYTEAASEDGPEIDMIQNVEPILQSLNASPAQRYGGTMVEIGNKALYVLSGGRNDQGYISSIETLNEQFQKDTVGTLNVPVAFACGAKNPTEDIFYLVGGYGEDGIANQIQKFTFQQAQTGEINNLEQLSPVDMPVKLFAASCAAYGNKLYIFGGVGESGYLATVYEYNMSTNEISRKSDMPAKCAYGAIQILNDKIILLGGANETGCLNTVYMYDVNSDRWTQKTSMEVPRQNFTTAQLSGEIYVFGGESSYTTNGIDELLTNQEYNYKILQNAVESYNPETDTWSRRPDATNACAGGMALGTEPPIFIGGWDGSFVEKADCYFPAISPERLSVVTQNGKAHITWEKVPDATGYDLEVNGSVIDVGDVDTYDYTVDEMQRYDFRIRAKYQNTFTLWSQLYCYEMYGTMQDARPFMLNASIQDRMYRPGQVKWYKIDSDTNGITNFTLNSGSEEYDYRMSLYSEQGELMMNDQQNTAERTINNFVVNGTLFIKVSALNATPAAPKYTLRSSFADVESSDIPTRMYTNMNSTSHEKEEPPVSLAGEEKEEGPTFVGSDGTESVPVPDVDFSEAVIENLSDQDVELASLADELYISGSLNTASDVKKHPINVNTSAIPTGKKGKIVVELDEVDEENYFQLEWVYENNMSDFYYWWNDGLRTSWLTGIITRGSRGSYSLKVKAKEYDPNVSHSYRLKISLLVGDAGDEDYIIDNGTLEYASGISTSSMNSIKNQQKNLTISRKLDYKNDRDYYKVYLNSGDKISITFTEPPGKDYGVRIVDADHNELADSLADGLLSSMSYIAPASEYYYLYVVGGDYSVNSPYTLNIYYSTASNYDAFEVNDRADKIYKKINQLAPYIGDSGKKANAISFGYDFPLDEEFYPLSAEKGEKITVELKKKPGVIGNLNDYAVQIYSECDLPLDVDDPDAIASVHELISYENIAKKPSGEESRFISWVASRKGRLCVRIKNKNRQWNVYQRQQFDLIVTRTKSDQYDPYELTYSNDIFSGIWGPGYLNKYSNDYLKLQVAKNANNHQPIYATTAYELKSGQQVNNATLDNELDIDWYMLAKENSPVTKTFTLQAGQANHQEKMVMVLATVDQNNAVSVLATGSQISHRLSPNAEYFIGVCVKDGAYPNAAMDYTLSLSDESTARNQDVYVVLYDSPEDRYLDANAEQYTYDKEFFLNYLKLFSGVKLNIVLSIRDLDYDILPGEDEWDPSVTYGELKKRAESVRYDSVIMLNQILDSLDDAYEEAKAGEKPNQYPTLWIGTPHFSGANINNMLPSEQTDSIRYYLDELTTGIYEDVTRPRNKDHFGGMYFGREADFDYDTENIWKWMFTNASARIHDMGKQVLWIPFSQGSSASMRNYEKIAKHGFDDKGNNLVDIMIIQPNYFYYEVSPGNEYKQIMQEIRDAVETQWSGGKETTTQIGFQIEVDASIFTGRIVEPNRSIPNEKKEKFLATLQCFRPLIEAGYAYAIYCGGPNEQGFSNSIISGANNQNRHSNRNFKTLLKEKGERKPFYDFYNALSANERSNSYSGDVLYEITKGILYGTWSPEVKAFLGNQVY